MIKEIGTGKAVTLPIFLPLNDGLLISKLSKILVRRCSMQRNLYNSFCFTAYNDDC